MPTSMETISTGFIRLQDTMGPFSLSESAPEPKGLHKIKTGGECSNRTRLLMRFANQLSHYITIVHAKTIGL